MSATDVGRGRILGIETSCDETAAAVVEGGTSILSSVVCSQVDLHARYGGVVPEIASRAHVDLIVPVVAQAFVEAGLSDRPVSTAPCEVDAVAATVGPGLVGSLLVGVSAAKALALVWDVPFVAVNHLEAHLYAALLEDPDLELPLVVLLVSGGHTLLVHMEDHGRYRARVDHRRRRRRGLRQGGPLPRPRLPGRPGHRPAVDHDGDPRGDPLPAGDARRRRSTSPSAGSRRRSSTTSASTPTSPPPTWRRRFQEAVVDVLVAKARAAARQVGAKGLCLGGGVAANSRLRERFARRVRRGRGPGLPAEPGHVHRQRRHGGQRGVVPLAERRPEPPRHRAPTRTWLGDRLSTRRLRVLIWRGVRVSTRTHRVLTPHRKRHGGAKT